MKPFSSACLLMAVCLALGACGKKKIEPAAAPDPAAVTKVPTANANPGANARPAEAPPSATPAEAFLAPGIPDPVAAPQVQAKEAWVGQMLAQETARHTEQLAVRQSIWDRRVADLQARNLSPAELNLAVAALTKELVLPAETAPDAKVSQAWDALLMGWRRAALEGNEQAAQVAFEKAQAMAKTTPGFLAPMQLFMQTTLRNALRTHAMPITSDAASRAGAPPELPIGPASTGPGKPATP